jgi:hypothetical protein
MKSIYTERAERRAREENDASLAAALEEYARGIEADGQTYAPAYMREAACRLLRGAPVCDCGAPNPSREHYKGCAVTRAAER